MTGLPTATATTGQAPTERRRWLGVVLGAAVGSVLVGCGFRPRGEIKPSFVQLRTNLSSSNGVGAVLRQRLSDVNVALMPLHTAKDKPLPDDADRPVLTVESDQREKTIIAKTVDGQIRELQLRVRFIARVTDGDGREWMPRTEWVLTQNLGYNETLAYGKELEEALMLPKMEQDIADQVMRRLSVLRAPGR